MKMFSPPHPGEILKEMWIKPLGMTLTQTAKALNVSRKTLSEIVNGKSAITPEMAVRLELVLGCSAETWLGIQSSFDLWQVKKNIKALGINQRA